MPAELTGYKHNHLLPLSLLAAQEKHMDVNAQTYVIGEIITHMIGVVINHDFIPVPVPAAQVDEVESGEAKIESTEPEAFGPSSNQSPMKTWAEAAGEAAMLPRPVHMIVGVVPPTIVTDPTILGIHVRHLGMAREVAEGSTVLPPSMVLSGGILYWWILPGWVSHWLRPA